MTSAAPVGDTAPLPVRGDRVLLDGLPGGPWPTVVDGVADDGLRIAPPRLGGRPVPLPLRRPFMVAYSHRQVPCEVDAELVAGPGPGGAEPYHARVTGMPRRIQRRGAVRVPVHLIARASIDGDGEPIGAVTENLSAGGALLRSPRPVDQGTEMGVTIDAGGDAGSFEVLGRVVRCDRTEVEHRPWRIAIAFADLSHADEDRLVRFVFERQRALRARDSGMA